MVLPALVWSHLGIFTVRFAQAFTVDMVLRFSPGAGASILRVLERWPGGAYICWSRHAGVGTEEIVVPILARSSNIGCAVE